MPLGVIGGKESREIGEFVLQTYYSLFIFFVGFTNNFTIVCITNRNIYKLLFCWYIMNQGIKEKKEGIEKLGKGDVKKKEIEKDETKKEDIKKPEEEDEESIIRENIRSFLKSAQLVYKSSDFTSATILYFKTLFVIFDLLILRRIGRIPKDHGERFRILESNYSELYIILDKIYPIYRNTYTAKINKETADMVKENVERIIKEQRIFEGN